MLLIDVGSDLIEFHLVIQDHPTFVLFSCMMAHVITCVCCHDLTAFTVIMYLHFFCLVYYFISYTVMALHKYITVWTMI